MNIDSIISYLNDLLSVNNFNDFCPNGLQVAGKFEIKKIVTGVTANQAFIQKSIEANADLCLVHHGFFWKGEDQRIIGMKHARLKSLISNDINLAAYHLPLDAHDDFGNNVQLAKRLGVVLTGHLDDGMSPAITRWGNLDKSISGDEFANNIEKSLNRRPLHIAGSLKKIKKVAICTGAAQDFIQVAAEAGCDAFITGEVSERTVDMAKELGIHFYASGHYATEMFGIQALGDLLSEMYGLEHQFIPVYNPV